jgi:endonuclease YncB( thermonuclease family)
VINSVSLFGMLSTLVSALILTPPSAAAPKAATGLEGVVTQVGSGDTLRFTPKAGPALEVRLRDIDAPLPCQPGGAQARQALADLALNKPARLRPAGRDAQGRTVAVLLVDEVNVGQRLVEDGQAWSQRVRNDQGPLVKQERMAKALGRGLHASPGAVMPGDWRRTRGDCATVVARPNTR